MEIRHRPGVDNANADGPSRNPCASSNIASTTMEEPHPVQVTFSDALVFATDVHDSQDTMSTADLSDIRLSRRQLAIAQQKDTFFGPLYHILNNAAQGISTLQDIEATKQRASFFVLKDALLYRRSCLTDRNDTSSSRDVLQLCVPASLVGSVLTTYHCSPWGGHNGMSKTVAILRRRFFWRHMRRTVAKFINGCLQCATVKQSVPGHHGMLQHIVATRPFEIVSLDLIQSLKETPRGNKHILVMVDHFTNWVEAVPVPDMSAATISEAFYEHIICRHSAPDVIVTDQGKQFMDALFKHLNRQMSIKQRRTTPYHPQTNTKAERFNKSLIRGIACFANAQQSDWDLLIPSYLLAYRSSVIDGLGESPFFLLYGRDPRLPADLFYAASKVENSSEPLDSAALLDRLRSYKHRLVQRLQKAYEELSSQRKRANEKNKRLYDHGQRDLALEDGSLVLVYYGLQKTGLTTKLIPKFRGPYRVIRRLGVTNYQLRHTVTGQELPNIHVKRLRAFSPFDDIEVANVPLEEDLSADPGTSALNSTDK